MVYKFDPTYFNGTIFSLEDTWEMSGDWDEYERNNQLSPRPVSPNR
jgi:hypothetical protein